MCKSKKKHHALVITAGLLTLLHTSVTLSMRFGHVETQTTLDFTD